MTSGSLQLCPEIIHNILIVPEFIYLVLTVQVLLADATQLGKLFHVFTTLLVQDSSGDEIANVNFYAVRPGSYPNSLK